MADNSKIEWTNATWSPVRGCSMVSSGCNRCYAMASAHRWQHQFGVLTHRGPHGMVWNGDVHTFPELLEIPARWKQPRLIFVNSQSDTFHEKVPEQFITEMLTVMALTPWHTYQVLTKRPERAAEYLRAGDHGILDRLQRIERGEGLAPHWVFRALRRRRREGFEWEWPLRNMWLGTSVEDQWAADERIPWLRAAPAAIRFLSCEPLLGRVDLGLGWNNDLGRWDSQGRELPLRRIDWVIVGGESGYRARAVNLAWMRSLVAQCQDHGVACFVKQLGAKPYDIHPDKPDLRRAYLPRHPKGGDILEFPPELQVRQFPTPRPAEVPA